MSSRHFFNFQLEFERRLVYAMIVMSIEFTWTTSRRKLYVDLSTTCMVVLCYVAKEKFTTCPSERKGLNG